MPATLPMNYLISLSNPSWTVLATTHGSTSGVRFTNPTREFFAVGFP